MPLKMEKKKNPTFKISQTSFDLSRSIAAKLNACGQLKGLCKVFFPNFGFPEGNGNPLRYSRLENPVDGRSDYSQHPLKPKPNPEIGEGDGTPLQYSCLESAMDGGAW